MPERRPWTDEGFARPPDEKTAKGGEVVYRGSGGSSRVLGNCFFAPTIDGVPLGYWTAELLERELNAALWGNDFEKLVCFRLVAGVHYRIGPIAHDRYSGVDNGMEFQQRSWITPSGIFRQVTIVLPPGEVLNNFVTQVGEPISLAYGRYAREASRRAKKWKQ